MAWYSTDPSGKRKKHYKTKGGFKTKAEAKLYESKIEIAKSANKLSDKNPVFTDYFNEWAKIYRLPGKAANTKKRYDYIHGVLTTYFGQKKIGDITRADYQEFLNDYGKDHAKNTITKTVRIIAASARDAYGEGIISSDFTFKSQIIYNDKKTRKVKYLSIKELQALVSQLKNGLNHEYVSRYIILAGIYTGARIGELLALRWSDIDFKNKTISITRSYDYKNDTFKAPKTKNSIRQIRVNDGLLADLKQLQQNNHELVFAKEDGTLPSTVAVNKALRYNMKKAGLNKKNFHFHSLRHCHVAYLYSQHIDWYKISKRLGHSSVSFTMQQYSYLIDELSKKSDDEIDAALSKLDVR